MPQAIRFILIILATFSLSACFTPTAKIKLKADIDNAKLYQNSVLKMDIGKDFIEFEVEAEKPQTFEVKALSEDEEWECLGSVTITLAKDTITEKRITTNRKETPKRIARIAHEKKLREAKRVARRVKDTWQKRLAKQGNS